MIVVCNAAEPGIQKEYELKPAGAKRKVVVVGRGRADPRAWKQRAAALRGR